MAKEQEELRKCEECEYAYGDESCKRFLKTHRYTGVETGLRARNCFNNEGKCPDFKAKVK